MRIALDAMGGDDAPRAMIQGALDWAQANPDHEVILVGREEDIRAHLTAERATARNLVIEHAPEIIGMTDKIAALKDKPGDSMNRCAQMVKQGKADAMVLCGNTACSVAAAQLHLRRIPGVRRAGILAPLPKLTGHTWVCDAGANVEGKPEQLAQFAELTTVFLEVAYGKAKARIGVLANGHEDEKGNELSQQTLALLRRSDLNLAGHVEGHDIYLGDLDVVVCDGFTGNIVLKTSEGLEKAMRLIIREEVTHTFAGRLGGMLIRPGMQRVKRRVDWRFVGGCFLLGVDGNTIIGHGRSDRLAVFHALGQAARCVETKVLDAMRARFKGRIGHVIEV